MASASALAYNLRGVARSIGTSFRERPIRSTLGLGLGVGGVGVAMAPVGALYEAKHTSLSWKRDKEASVMANLLATAQVGPFGTGDRPYGMGSNYGGAADMTLALHYARNGTGIRDPFFQMAGRFGKFGRFFGENI